MENLNIGLCCTIPNIHNLRESAISSVMYAVTGRHFRSQKAILRDYARFTVKGESYPGIIPVTNAITEGKIYLNVDEPSLEQLDIFEGDLYLFIKLHFCSFLIHNITKM